jgi:ankyrin repeat protein
MYPNPQDALPLPPRPNLEQYKKRAKDLARACKSGEPDAIRVWAVQWIETLTELHGESDRPWWWNREHINRLATRVEEFSRIKLSPAGLQPPKCSLADAQFVIARAHGFASWPGLVTHIESLARSSSRTSAFEAAADAIVAGDASTLARLLRENPELVRARSTREHNATLLHYVSANGVEGYRQKSPKNAARIAEMLLEAGAEVDAEADVYGGGCTTLGLVATSAPPASAGVQQDVMDVLLGHGARIAHPGTHGDKRTLVRACLSNGQPQAAEYLMSRGAPLDLASAAGTGRVDIVRRFFSPGGLEATSAELLDGFAFACTYGRVEVVDFLLDQGLEVNAELRSHGEGHTGLHAAAYHGHVDVVKALLRRGARVEVIDKTWGTPPLIWAMTGWSRKPAAEGGPYYEVVARLIAAGANVKHDLLEWDKARADPKMLAALSGKLQPE